MVTTKTILTTTITGGVALIVIAAVMLGGGDGETLVQTGSSTVLPLAQLWAEDFDGAEVSVSGGGSSHGLNALLTGEADLGDASRLLKGKDYAKVGCDETGVNPDGTANAACKGVRPHKWVVAYDVLTVVIHNDNDWATQLNYTQLYKIFSDDNPAVYWDEVPGLNDSAPRQKIEIYAPDEASGTYDFFFEQVIEEWGKEGQVAGTRLESGDGVYNPSADDNVILNNVKQRKYSIGYFGFAYYNENQKAVQTVDIAAGDDNYEQASLANVADYPMSRPLHIYTDDNSDKRDTVAEYLQFGYSEQGQKAVDEVGYVRVSAVNQIEFNQMKEEADSY